MKEIRGHIESIKKHAKGDERDVPHRLDQNAAGEGRS